MSGRTCGDRTCPSPSSGSTRPPGFTSSTNISTRPRRGSAGDSSLLFLRGAGGKGAQEVSQLPQARREGPVVQEAMKEASPHQPHPRGSRFLGTPGSRPFCTFLIKAWTGRLFFKYNAVSATLFSYTLSSPQLAPSPRPDERTSHGIDSERRLESSTSRLGGGCNEVRNSRASERTRVPFSERSGDAHARRKETGNGEGKKALEFPTHWCAHAILGRRFLPLPLPKDFFAPDPRDRSDATEFTCERE